MIELRDGRILGKLTLPDFGVTAMAHFGTIGADARNPLKPIGTAISSSPATVAVVKVVAVPRRG